MSNLTSSNLTALISLVENEIDNNASLDEIQANEEYMYSLLGKLSVMMQQSQTRDMMSEAGLI